MRIKRHTILIAAMAFFCSPFVMFAHHGEARYDMSKVVTMKGKVTAFEFSNPHAEVQFEITDAKGKVELWTGEATSPNMLARAGWSRVTLKAGDQITATGYRSKGDTRILLIDKIILPNGEMLEGRIRFDK